MKKALFSLCFALNLFLLNAQMPYIGTTTVIPQNPTPNDFIKLVTQVITPNQGGLVDIGHTVTAQQIKLRGCYWHGMLPATQTHIDTFMIGQLPAGFYQIDHKAYMSTTQQWCNKTDSNSVITSFQVSTVTGLAKNADLQVFSIYPNPAPERLMIRGIVKSAEAFIFSTSGELVLKEQLIAEGDYIDIHNLPDALYYIRISDKNRTVTRKFVKSILD